MSCLDTIIGIDRKCNDISLSGLYVFDAPEISTKNIANIVNEDTVNGKALIAEKITLAKTLIYNDFMSIVTSNGFIAQLSDHHYQSGEFDITKTYAAEANKERGLILKRVGQRGIRGTVIYNVYVYPLADKTDAELNIYEDYNGGIVSTYTVDLVANEVNTFEINHKLKGSYAKVLLDGTDLPVVSSKLTCTTGCSGRKPNDCGNTAGYYNGKELSSKEGFGINIDFGCVCDYEQFLCEISKTYLGEIFWLKVRVMILEEAIRSNRLNNWVIYQGDELKDYAIDIENQYRDKWNTFVAALPNILRNSKDACFDCRNFRWVVNI
jgi:hypothetical protein